MDIDESKNKLESSFSIITTQASITYLLCALMIKSNGNKWAVHIRRPIGNALVEHKYRDSLSIKVRNIYKRKEE